MNDFMYEAVMQKIEEKLQLELQLIRLRSEMINQRLEYESKINNLELELAKSKCKLITYELK